MSDKDIGFFWANLKLLNVTWMTGINTVIVNQKEKEKHKFVATIVSFFLHNLIREQDETSLELYHETAETRFQDRRAFVEACQTSYLFV